LTGPDPFCIRWSMKALPFAGTLSSFSPLRPYFARNRWPIVIGLLSLLTVDFLQLLIPLVIKQAVDQLTNRTATPASLLTQGGTILGIALLIVGFRYTWRRLIFGHSRDVERRLRSRIYEHLQTLSLSFYHRIKTGDLMARAINDINGVRMATGMGLVALTDGLVMGTAAVGFMLSISVNLTLIALIPAPAVIALTSVLTRRMSARFEAVQDKFSDLTERVREAFSGIRIVKAYTRESWKYRRVESEGKDYIDRNMALAKTLALFFPLMSIFTNLGLVAVIGFGGRLAIMGAITTGDFVAFISYLNLLTWPMMAMGWVTNLIQRGSSSMRRINRVLEESPDIRTSAGARPLASVSGDVRVLDLAYTYPGQTFPALTDIRFQARPGETVVLVGPVGSGKTTLLRMIPRLLDPPPGSVYLDGRDIRGVPLKDLRESIGFVTQDVFVFSDTIRNNVLFGRTGVSEADIMEALHISDLLDEVQALEHGLETRIGERGISLSGGQRQRLTIARALLLDPPILILDDGLSMVDTRTEARILDRILGRRQGKTNLIVTHRVNAIGRADRIVVLEEGRVAGEGSHEHLLRDKGPYARLYERFSIALDTGS